MRPVPSGHHVRRVFLVAGLWALLALVPAQAGFTATVAPPAGPVPVDGGQVFSVTYAIDCPTVLQAGGAAFDSSITVDPPAAPRGIVVLGAMTFHLNTTRCATDPAGTVTAKAQFVLVASTQAAGLVPLSANLSATLRYSGPTPAPAATAVATVPFTVAYRGALERTVPSTILQAEPGADLAYVVVVTNLGNAATSVQLVPTTPPGWTVEVPAPMTLAAGQAADLALHVRSSVGEGWNNKETTIPFQVTGHAAQDPSQAAPPVSTNVLARVRGSALAGHSVPSAVLLLLVVAVLAAVAGVVLWVARRRK